MDICHKSKVATITVAHPDKKNALSGHMMCQFHDISLELEQRAGELKGFLLTSQRSSISDADGEGSHPKPHVFCSGGDMSTVKQICTPESGHKMSYLLHDILIRLRHLPLVSVCYVNGRAIGGGAELTLIPDFRIFHPSAGQLRFVQARMGVANGWGGGKMLTEIVGRKSALRLLLSCASIDAGSAEKLGLCDGMAHNETEAKHWMEQMIGPLDIEVIQAAKKITSNASQSHLTLEEALKNEREIFSGVWGGSANLKALNDNLKH